MDHNIANPEDIGWGGFSPAPQDGAHSCHEFPGIERFGQIVIGSALESGDAVSFIASRSEHDDWDLRRYANPAKDIAAVSTGQHYVQDDERIVAMQGLLEARLRIVYGCQVETVDRQQASQGRTQLDVVIH
jgi:hypothetical protein